MAGGPNPGFLAEPPNCRVPFPGLARFHGAGLEDSGRRAMHIQYKAPSGSYLDQISNSIALA